MIEIKKSFMTKNRCYSNPQKITPVGLMLHSVGCPQPKPEVFIRLWNDAGKDVSIHGFIGENEAFQTLPYDYKGWHAGRGTSGKSANGLGYIGFEMTEPATIKYTGGASFVDNNPEKTLQFVKNTYKNAVDVFAQLCILYNFNPMGKNKYGYNVIISHSEGYKAGIASNHGDVEHLWSKTIRKTMDDFRKDVSEKIKEYGGKIPENNTNTENKNENSGNNNNNNKNNVIYRVQVGSFSNKANAERLAAELKNKGYQAIVVSSEKMGNNGGNSGKNVNNNNIQALKIGDIVQIKQNCCVYGTNKKFASWVYNSKLYIRGISGDKVIISTQKTGAITGTVSIDNIIKI